MRVSSENEIQFSTRSSFTNDFIFFVLHTANFIMHNKGVSEAFCEV